MSSPLSNLKKEKRTPIGQSSRQAPYKASSISDEELISKVLAEENSKGRRKQGPNAVSNNDLMSSMITRISTVEKQLAYFEEMNREKDKKIKVLQEKCEIYKNAQGYGSNQVVELERKCHKLQRQIHGMENFLEDYGMIWIGTNNSSDEEEEKEDECKNNLVSSINGLWKPESSIIQNRQFCMDYDLVLRNIEELNNIAGEGEHFIQHTKDGARLQVKEPIHLTLYLNGILMFSGPFRSFQDKTTQICMQDLMDGYFPSELQTSFPDGVPFKVEDKRDTFFKDKRMEKLFPGEGYSLSPEKRTQADPSDTSEDISSAQPSIKVETANENVHQMSVDNFLSKLSSSVIKSGKIIDIRGGLKEVLQDKPTKNDVLVVETEVLKDMKTRLNSGLKSRPQTPGNVATLRIKSETGDQTFVLKMFYTQTLHDVRKHIDNTRDLNAPDYDLKTSFPNLTYTDLQKTLRESGLVPNATLHMVPRK